eukprot:scaffold6316_cov113-Skeletonema_marinoi.AAC.6
MDYSADLPINSMGRRVRSRLYFTSESHLHSMLNVLRFESTKENSVPSPLSERGRKILANASELCYLTQVVIRLFEDTQKPSEDPKRFRVEILFSPGATATPRHMAELYREKDAARFDTEKLQKISIEGLTCTQVEEFFEQAIRDGKTSEDADESSKGTDVSDAEKETKKKKKAKKNKLIKAAASKPAVIDKVNEKADIGSNKVESKVEDAASDIVEEASALLSKEVISDSASTELVEDHDRKEHVPEEAEVNMQDGATNDGVHVWQNAALAGVLIGASCYLVMAMTKRR